MIDKKITVCSPNNCSTIGVLQLQVDRMREALINIYNASAPDRGLTMRETTQIYCCARDALKKDK